MPSALLAKVAYRIGHAKADPRLTWRGQARPEQLMPGGDWRVWYVQGGRGSGKTRSGAGALAEIMAEDTDSDGQFGIVAPTYRDAWTVCVEGEAGILRALGTSAGEVKEGVSAQVTYAHRSYGEIGLRTGHTIYVDSADDGALRVQGKNLRAIWADEVGLWTRWETAWNESIRYAVRRGVSKIIATGTPKASRPARRLIRSLIRGDPEHGGVVVTRLRTIDNAANLSDAFMRAVVGAARGTRLERQELEGELLDDVANALWTRDLLDAVRVYARVGEEGGPEYVREIKIGVDPSDGSETSDEQAYTVVGLGPVEDGHLWVMENWGGQEAPVPFAKRVIRRASALAAEHSCPVELIIEKNHGGAWLKATFAQVMKQMKVTVPYRVIHASQAKRTRAEPVSALYEMHGGIVRHCHIASTDSDGHRLPDRNMPELEDQMATFTGAQGERSPDRLDSLVWACTPYLRRSFGPPGRSGPRPWAAKAELDAIGDTPSAHVRKRLAGAHGRAYAGDSKWSLDDFAPADDDQVPVNGGSRANVKAWR